MKGRQLGKPWTFLVHLQWDLKKTSGICTELCLRDEVEVVN